MDKKNAILNTPPEESREELHRHLLSGWRFKVVLFTVLLSIIGYFLFTIWGGWDNVVGAIKKAGISGISIALLLSLSNFCLRFLRWQFFLNTLGHNIPWGPSFRIYMAGFSLTTTPGKSGEALRGVFLKDYGVPFRKSIGAFFSERVSDLLAVTILASTGLWIYPEARPILFIVIFFLAFIIFAVQKDSCLRLISSSATKILPSRFAHSIEFMIETIKSFRRCFTLKVQLVTITLGVLAWTAEAFALYYLLHLLGTPVDFIVAVFIYGFSLVIGGITLLPGGLGGAEVTMLQLLMLNNVPTSIAVAITLVIRLTSLWFSVFLGLIFLPKKQIFFKD